MCSIKEDLEAQPTRERERERNPVVRNEPLKLVIFDEWNPVVEMMFSLCMVRLRKELVRTTRWKRVEKISCYVNHGVVGETTSITSEQLPRLTMASNKTS